MTKVGIFHNDLNICGGAEFVVANIIKVINDLKCKLFLASSKKFFPQSVHENFGFDVFVDDSLVIPVTIPNVGNAYWWTLFPSLIRRRCDILINAYSNSILPFVDITYFHSFKGLVKNSPENMLEKIKSLYFLPYFFSQKILSSSDLETRLIFANTQFVADGIKKLLQIQPKILHPPVDVCAFSTSNEPFDRKPIVLTISRFAKEKNLDELPKVASKIDAKFILIGSVYDAETFNYYRSFLSLIKKNGLENKLFVYPNLSLYDKISLLKKSRVYFHTMKSEDFGISIVEGMAASCIPVTHNSGGPKEFVPKEYLYEDTDTAIQKVNDALTNYSSSIGLEMSSISQNFSLQSFQKKFLEYLSSYSLSLRR